MRHIVLWQNIFSPHREGEVRALMREPGTTVTWIAKTAMSQKRASMGWDPAHIPGCEQIVDPDARTIDDLCDPAARNRIHVHTGLQSQGYAVDPLPLFLKRDLLWGSFLEKGNIMGWKTPLVRAKYRLLGRRFGHRISFMLVAGHTGMDFYRRGGWPTHKLFPYGYFPAPMDQTLSASTDSEGKAGAEHRIIFIGALSPHKSVHTLMTALAALKERSWRLCLVGDGPEREALMSLAHTTGLAERVQFDGMVTRTAALERLARQDLLVLPSTYDGWGSVVNEALMVGVPAIASDACGASDLLQEPLRGGVFPKGDGTSLQALIARELDGGRPGARRRVAIATWADTLHRVAAGRYLTGIFDHIQHGAPRPEGAPWSAQTKPSDHGSVSSQISQSA